MTPLARLCLATGLSVISLASIMNLTHSGPAQTRTYVVQSNDTLSAIAYRFHTTVWQLVNLNGLTDPNALQAGQLLTVPGETWGGRSGYADPDMYIAPHTRDATVSQASALSYSTTSASTTSASATSSTYIVVPGDTLSALSVRFGVSMSALVSANGISSPDLLRVGQALMIPTGARAMTSATLTSSASSLATGATTSSASPTSGSTLSQASATGATLSPASGLSATTASRSAVGALLASEAQAYGVDPALIKAVAWQESGWQMVTAADGGIGVMQLMPATAAWVGPALLGRAINPYNLTDNIQAGVALLASYLRQYGGNVQMALAAYNEGPQNLASGIVPSTASYIANVLALRNSFAQ